MRFYAILFLIISIWLSDRFVHSNSIPKLLKHQTEFQISYINQQLKLIQNFQDQLIKKERRLIDAIKSREFSIQNAEKILQQNPTEWQVQFREKQRMYRERLSKQNIDFEGITLSSIRLC